MHQPNSQKKKISRRTLLATIMLIGIYPLLRFIGFKVPKKPEYVKISTPMPTRGYIITSDFILFDKAGSSWAISRKCTHLGCKVNYLEDQNIIQCPCHHSQFDPTSGVPLQGPAKKELPKLVVEKRDSAPFYVITT